MAALPTGVLGTGRAELLLLPTLLLLLLLSLVCTSKASSWASL
jgi:hypothetical protein